MKKNQFLTVYGLVVALALAGVGYYLFSKRSAYQSVRQNYEAEASKLARLQRQVPYPNSENVAKKSEALQAYREEVISLHEAMLERQALLPEVAPSEFPDILKRKVVQVTRLARREKMNVPEDFYLGMNLYQRQIPAEEFCNMLGFQLDSIEKIVQLLVESDVESIEHLSRELLPGEGGQEQNPPAKQGQNYYQTYPLHFVFTASHRALEDFLNAIANEEQFLVARAIRVSNEVRQGPLREDSSRAQAQEAPEEDFFEDAPASENLSGPDYEFLLGDERLRCYLRIDLLRFSEIELNEDEKQKGGRA